MLIQREDKENTSGCSVFTNQPISLAMARIVSFCIPSRRKSSQAAFKIASLFIIGKY